MRKARLAATRSARNEVERKLRDPAAKDRIKPGNARGKAGYAHFLAHDVFSCATIPGA